MYVEELHLEATRNCTLECEHCLRGNRQAINMDTVVLDKIFKYVKNVGTLLLTGGEPLLAIEILERLVEILKTKQVRVNKIMLITNGTVLDDRILKLLHDLQDNSYLTLKLSTDIFHQIDLEKKGLLELRNKNLEILSKDNFYNFNEYGKDEESYIKSSLMNKGKAKELTPERLEEINSISKTEWIINNWREEKHPRTTLIDNMVEGNITIDVYGNIVSKGLSFDEEDKEAYETGLNIINMPFDEAIKEFIDRNEKIIQESTKKSGIFELVKKL